MEIEEGVTASTDNTLRDLHNSSYDTKAEFNNCFIVHSKIIPSLKTKLKHGVTKARVRVTPRVRVRVVVRRGGGEGEFNSLRSTAVLSSGAHERRSRGQRNSRAKPREK